MRSLIIGFGEVGKGLGKILDQYYETYAIDKYLKLKLSKGQSFEMNEPIPEIEIMHICLPYSDNFISDVKQYQEEFKPKYTVIHSTVPVGTSKACSSVHSPIRGLHPNLAQGISTFVKFLGGEQASEVADYFRRAGIKVILVDKAETTEAGKLFDTEYYRVCIEFAHRVKEYCNKNELNFHEVYTLFNQTYNEGYTELGHKEFIRPTLQPIMKPIGGHCVLPNKELIKLSEND